MIKEEPKADVLDHSYRGLLDNSLKLQDLFFEEQKSERPPVLPAILIVDDEAMNIEVIQAMIENLNHKSDACMSGQEALTLIEARIQQFQLQSQEMYKIIILDYSMPQMDGPQVALHIRQRLEQLRIRIPYICCATAYTEHSFKQNAAAYGMDYFLTKPFSYHELKIMLEKLT